MQQQVEQRQHQQWAELKTGAMTASCRTKQRSKTAASSSCVRTSCKKPNRNRRAATKGKGQWRASSKSGRAEMGPAGSRAESLTAETEGRRAAIGRWDREGEMEASLGKEDGRAGS